MASNHRRADGRLRPSYARHQARRRAAREALRDQEPERAAWLARFDPGARAEFFHRADGKLALWRRPFAEQQGVSEEDAEPMLRAIAQERGWLTLATADGEVVGVAPRRESRPVRKRREVGEKRRAILLLAAASPHSTASLYEALIATRPDVDQRKFYVLLRSLQRHRLIVYREGNIIVTDAGIAAAGGVDSAA